MQNLILLSDGSVHAQSKIGYGAYLVVPEPGLTLEELKLSVRVRRFTQTSSTKLELQTLLWALSDIQVSECKVIIYTDSQNIIGLPGRREQLERKAYRSSKNRLFNNHELYQEFYRLTDLLDYELVKVNGHLVSKQKQDIDRLFTLVDRASRQALRGES
jgi:ribonuclease HI